MIPVNERVMQKVVVDGNGCWIFTGYLDKFGYGQINRGGRGAGMGFTHRVLFEYHHGTIEGGLDLDHLCRVHACCNPQHLEPVTRRVNLLRGNTFLARNAAKVECHVGHPFDSENTLFLRTGGRQCRTCNHDRYVRRRDAQRARSAA